MLGPGCCCEDEPCEVPSADVSALAGSGTCNVNWLIDSKDQVIIEGWVKNNGVIITDVTGGSGEYTGTLTPTGTGIEVYVKTKCGSTSSGPIASCPPPPPFCNCLVEPGFPATPMPYVTFHLTGNAIGLPFAWDYRGDILGLAAPADVDVTADYIVECDVNTRLYPIYIPDIIVQYIGDVTTPAGRYTPAFDYSIYYCVSALLRYCHNYYGINPNYLIEFYIASGFQARPVGIPPPPGTGTGSGLSIRGAQLKFNTDHPVCPASLVTVNETAYMKQICNPFWLPTCRDPIDCYDLSGLGLTWDMTYGVPL